MNTPTIVFCLTISHDNRGYYKYGEAKDLQFRHSLYALSQEIEATTGSLVGYVLIEDLRKGGVFNKYYVLDTITDNGLIFTEVKNPICPKVVINRRKDELYFHPLLSEAPWKIYNNPQIAKLGNKETCYQLYEMYMPLTMIVDRNTNRDAVKAFIGRILDDKVVLKPLRLNGGRDIEVVAKTDMGKYLTTLDGPHILQEFIETSEGVEGLAPGRHDVRLYTVDGKISLMAVRAPADNGYLANTSLGGSIEFRSASDIPTNLIITAQRIIKELDGLDGHYFVSLDFFFGNGRWYLVEINDQPGVPAEYQTAHAKTIGKLIADSVWEYANG